MTDFITQTSKNSAEALSMAMQVQFSRPTPCSDEMVRLLMHINDLTESINRLSLQLKRASSSALYLIEEKGSK